MRKKLKKTPPPAVLVAIPSIAEEALELGSFDGASAASRLPLRPPIMGTKCTCRFHMWTQFANLDEADNFAYQAYTDLHMTLERVTHEFANKAGKKLLACVFWCEVLRNTSYFDNAI